MRRPAGFGPCPVILSIAAFFAAAAYWVISFATYPDSSLPIHVLFRVGDLQYFPLIEALARLDFAPTYSPVFRGNGILQFPLGAFLIHAPLFAAFGWAGFVVADLVVAPMAALVIYAIMRRFGISTVVASIFAICAICGTLLPFFSAIELFWFRIPRPMVSNLFYFILLWQLTVLWQSPERLVARSRNWLLFMAGLGLALSLCLQSYVFNCAVGFTGFAAILAWHVRCGSLVWGRPLVTGVVIVGIVFAIASIPFVLQRLHGSDDLAVRLGMILVTDRLFIISRFFFDTAPIMGLICIAIAANSAFLRKLDPELNIALPIACIALPILAFISVLLFLCVTPTVIQPYQLKEVVDAALRIGFFLHCALIVDLIARRYRAKSGEASLMKKIPGAAVADVSSLVAVAFFGANFSTKIDKITSMRADFFVPADDSGFRGDLGRVMAALKQPLVSGGKPPVLLTNDHHVMTWWQMSRKGDVLMPDVFSVVLTDTEVETQLVQAGKYLGWQSDTFYRFLIQDDVVPRSIKNAHSQWFLGHNKYQARDAYRFSSMDDYPEELKSHIRAARWDNVWQLTLPLSTRTRLIGLFERTAPDPRFAPDVIVIARYRIFPRDSIPPAGYCKFLENANYRAWRRCG